MRTYILFLIIAIISSMKVSKKGIQFIKEIEKCKLEAYERYGKWRIGWGTTNDHYDITKKRIIKGLKIEQKEADAWFKKVLKRKEIAVNKYSQYKFNQNQFDALVSFVYGEGDIEKLTDKGKRNIEAISEKMLHFNTTLDGKFNQDLANRRVAEKRLFLSK